VIAEFIDVSHKDTPTPPKATPVITEANESTPGASLLDVPHHRKDPTMHTEHKG